MREIRQNKNAKKPIKHEHTWSHGNCPRLKDIQTATISFEVPQVPKICEITNMNCQMPQIITVHGFTKFQINNSNFFNHQIVLKEKQQRLFLIG